MPVAFLIALQFLTRLPVSLKAMPSHADMGRSMLWYPVVGALLGAVLYGACQLLAHAPTLIAAALVLSLWVGLTGGLHLDGLADSADAWAGGFGDKERTLTIMKDPRSGPMGVVALVLVLLLKFAALSELVASAPMAIFCALLIGRCAVLGLFYCTAYVRAGGLGQALSEHLPRAQTGVVLVLCAALVWLLAGAAGLWVLACAAAAFWLLRRVFIQRIGGTTGDTAGALLEIIECVVLLGWALY